MANLDKKIASELKSVKTKPGVFIVNAKSASIHDVSLSSLKYLLGNLKLNCCYVSLSNPHGDLTETLKEYSLPVDKMMIIDATGSSTKTKNKNITILNSNNNLTEISLAMAGMMNSKKIDFFVFDSITTLLIYHNAETVEKFFHFTINKMKTNSKTFIAFSSPSQKIEQIMPVLGEFCQSHFDI
jgi:archaellum biogenesis ATPase FlaH